jgi:hypothetical protein
MANILTYTEAVDNAAWTKPGAPDVTVTADTHAAPAFAGASAGMADTLADLSTASAYVHQTKAKGSNDTANWCASIYVRKDAITTRVPEFVMEFRDVGTTKARGVRLNTSTGVTGNYAGQTAAPTSHGVVDVDASWWRLWMIEPDNATGNTNIRFTIFPAKSVTETTGNSSALTGSIVVWGANVEKVDAVTAYQPDPFYAFGGEIALPLVGEAEVVGRTTSLGLGIRMPDEI